MWGASPRRDLAHIKSPEPCQRGRRSSSPATTPDLKETLGTLSECKFRANAPAAQPRHRGLHFKNTIAITVSSGNNATRRLRGSSTSRVLTMDMIQGKASSLCSPRISSQPLQMPPRSSSAAPTATFSNPTPPTPTAPPRSSAPCSSGPPRSSVSCRRNPTSPPSRWCYASCS